MFKLIYGNKKMGLGAIKKTFTPTDSDCYRFQGKY